MSQTFTNKITRVVHITISLMAFLVFMGCENNDEPRTFLALTDQEQRLVGLWSHQYQVNDTQNILLWVLRPDRLHISLHFKIDITNGTLKSTEMSGSDRWGIDNNTLVFDRGPTTIRKVTIIEMNDGKLKLRNTNGYDLELNRGDGGMGEELARFGLSKLGIDEDWVGK